MSEATQANRPLAVKTALDADDLLLTSISGEEELSLPFRYELDMQSTDDNIDPTKVVGLPATVRIDSEEGDTRYFNGVIAQFSHIGWGTKFSRYRAVLVPTFWFLDHTSDCRIFQEKTAKEIISKILSDRGVTDVRWQLTSDPPQREYCVQYRETDLNFIQRLLEEEGIFYFFEHANGKHTMVFADSASAYLEISDNEVEFPDPSHDYGGSSRVLSWERTYSFLSGKYAHTDYNFKTPSTSLVREQAKQKLKFKNVDNLETYDFHGRHMDAGRGGALAKIRMEEIEARHDVARGESTCMSFTPGGKFKFTEHRSEAEIGNSYVITRVHTSAEVNNYSGGAGFSCRNSFECIPVSVPFRPLRRTRKPVVEGPQTAIVVGPEGEVAPKGKGVDKEIYVDEHARVKVRFHWIRDGAAHGENSSCWMRVSQPWGGNGYGVMNIPRIGHEVIVDFIEGDPDHPIINGRVYNAESMPNASNAGRDVPSASSGGAPKYPGNQPPSDIPAAAMMTSFKSSSVGGEGSNEITMNDEAGSEGLMFKAQKDEIHTVGNDREDSVGNDESMSVGNNRFRKVGVNETIEIGTNQESKVGVNRKMFVGTAHSETIGVSQDISVGTSQSTNVGSTQSNSVGMSQTNNVGMMKNEMVGAISNEMVGVARALSVGAALNVAVGLSSTEQVGMQKSTIVGSEYKISAGSKFEIVCGSSKLTMDSGGKVTISGTEFKFAASGPVKINGAIIDLN